MESDIVSDKKTPDKSSIRQQMRVQRRQLSLIAQKQASQKAFKKILQQPWHKSVVQVAYHACDGEINPQPLSDARFISGQAIIHPVCSGYLLFQKYLENTRYTLNKFGILEPILDKSAIIPLKKIDIIYLPVVAFDLNGYRLGMGGGFYDRTLGTHQGKRPLLVGLAHEFQLVEKLPIENTDIPLDFVITPEKTWQFSRSNSFR